MKPAPRFAQLPITGTSCPPFVPKNSDAPSGPPSLTPLSIKVVDGAARPAPSPRQITNLDLLLFWWVLVELAERIWEYLSDEQYSRRGEDVDEWDTLAIAKRCCELAYQGVEHAWEIAFAEFYGRHPSKLIPIFVERAQAHQRARLARVIEFPGAVLRPGKTAQEGGTAGPSVPALLPARGDKAA